jgi:hypothetical protein
MKTMIRKRREKEEREIFLEQKKPKKSPLLRKIFSHCPYSIYQKFSSLLTTKFVYTSP